MQSQKPLVSIGLPTHDGEKYLRRALDSLLRQDYENIEIILSDNASTDSTPEILKEHAERDERIKLHTHPKNIGPIANFISLLEKAKGEYFMWAADDDIWLPGFVSKMVNELETHPDAGVAMCAIEKFLEDGSRFDIIRFAGKDNPNIKSHYQMVKGLTTMKKYNLFIYGIYRKEFLKKVVKHYPNVPAFDRILMCQIALATRFRYVDEILHKRMHHSVPFHKRKPDEKFNIMQREDKLVEVKMLYALGQMIVLSEVIPWYRKMYLPLVVWRFMVLRIYSIIARRLRQSLSANTWNRLRDIKKWIFLN